MTSSKRKGPPPPPVSHPGVYLEEIPAGVRTIPGVPTNITAFVGRALRGPTDKDETKSPVAINSFAEFERVFGGLWSESALGFAVRDFFLNSGSQALIVRVYKGVAGKKSAATFKIGPIKLKAASPGAWGGKLRVRIDHDTRVAPSFPREAVGKLFNLTVKDTQTGQMEMFRNVSVARDHPRQVTKVIEDESTLLKADGKIAAGAARPRANAAITAADPDPFSDNFPKRYTAVPASDQPSDGLVLQRKDISAPTLEMNKTGMYALLRADLFNLLCIPPHTLSAGATSVEPELVDDATGFCEKQRAFFLVDPPYCGDADIATAKAAIKSFASLLRRTNHAALYFPALKQRNPLNRGRLEEFAPCGAVAGVLARSDAQRGVWKTPAGQEAALAGVPQLCVALGDADNGELNSRGINCLRTIPGRGRAHRPLSAFPAISAPRQSWRSIEVRAGWAGRSRRHRGP